MNANELMIGDWVEINCFDQSIIKVKVATIDENMIVGKSESGTSHWGNIKDISPILLTPEILEKNGFVKELDKDNTHYRFGLTEGCTFFSVKYARSVFQWLGPLDFKYVHELQHALRLCGVEKEIIL